MKHVNKYHQKNYSSVTKKVFSFGYEILKERDL